MSIADKIQRLQAAKTAIATAITNKGGTVASGDGYEDFATDIATIPSGGGSPVISSLTVTPSTSQQTITAPSGTDGYSPITVNAVTSSIDNNITAGNIKKDVVILGVTGTYEGGGIGIPREINNGVYSSPTSNFTFTFPSNVTALADYSFSNAFNRCDSLTNIDLNNISSVGANAFNSACSACTFLVGPIDFSEITSVGSSAFASSFYSCSNLTGSVNFSSLTTVSSSSFQNAFSTCKKITSVSFASLSTISSSSVFSSAFQSCSAITSINFNNLTTLTTTNIFSSTFNGCTSLSSISFPLLSSVTGSSVFSSTFAGCSSLTSVNLPRLATLSGSSSMSRCFQNCTSLTTLSFPKLTSTSFGTYKNQFNNMLYGVTGCTVHFPSNLQSVIGSWADVTAGFGGTNTTVLFDLQATT